MKDVTIDLPSYCIELYEVDDKDAEKLINDFIAHKSHRVSVKDRDGITAFDTGQLVAIIANESAEKTKDIGFQEVDMDLSAEWFHMTKINKSKPIKIKKGRKING